MSDRCTCAALPISFRLNFSLDLPAAKATAMPLSVSASHDPVAVFILRAPCTCVPDEVGQLNGDEYAILVFILAALPT